MVSKLVLLVVLFSWLPLSCSTTPDPVTAAEQSDAAVNKARASIAYVLEQLDRAKEVTGPLPELATALEAFREEYDAERYNSALGHLRRAVALTEQAGAELPGDIPRRLAQAELLLGLAGQ